MQVGIIVGLIKFELDITPRMAQVDFEWIYAGAQSLSVSTLLLVTQIHSLHFHFHLHIHFEYDLLRSGEEYIGILFVGREGKANKDLSS